MINNLISYMRNYLHLFSFNSIVTTLFLYFVSHYHYYKDNTSHLIVNDLAKKNIATSGDVAKLYPNFW